MRDKIYSDAFTRQDMIFGIYDISVHKCVALVCYRFINVNSINLKDSWFNTFNSGHKSFFINNFSKGVILSLLGVRKEYRGKYKEINFSEVICASSSLEMLKFEWDCIITQTRNDRKVNEIGKKIGGITLDKSIPKYNTFGDILYFTHESMREASKSFDFETQNIYDHRIILRG